MMAVSHRAEDFEPAVDKSEGLRDRGCRMLADLLTFDGQLTKRDLDTIREQIKVVAGVTPLDGASVTEVIGRECCKQMKVVEFKPFERIMKEGTNLVNWYAVIEGSLTAWRLNLDEVEEDNKVRMNCKCTYSLRASFFLSVVFSCTISLWLKCLVAAGSSQGFLFKGFGSARLPKCTWQHSRRICI